MRHRGVLVGLTVLLAVGLAPAGAAPGDGPAAVTGCTVPVPGVDDHCEEWAHTYDVPDGDSLAAAEVGGYQLVAVSADSATVFAAGTSDVPDHAASDPVVVAVDASSGDRRWAATLADPDVDGHAHAIVADPAGEQVFLVTRNRSPGASCAESYDVAAFDAATGERQWAARHADAGCVRLGAVDVAGDGAAVYLVGTLADAEGLDRRHVAAFHTDTGAVAWEATTAHGEFAGGTNGTVLTVSPDGDEVIVAGAGLRPASPAPTVSAWVGERLDAATGASLGTFGWDVPRPDAHVPANSPAGIDVDPAGERIYLAGGAEHNAQRSYDITVVAFDRDASTAAWTASYDGPHPRTSFDSVWFGRPLQVSPDGATVFVAGYSTSAHGAQLSYDFVTLALDAASGDRHWATRYTSETYLNWLPSLAVAPDGSQVYVAGTSRVDAVLAGGRFTTLAYDAATGDQDWVARRTDGHTFASGLAATPDGTRVVVTGMTAGVGTRSQTRSDYDLLTVAYPTR